MRKKYQKKIIEKCTEAITFARVSRKEKFSPKILDKSYKPAWVQIYKKEAFNSLQRNFIRRHSHASMKSYFHCRHFHYTNTST